MENELSESSDSRRRFRKRWIAWAVLALWAGVGAWNVTKPMPAGTNVSTAPVSVPAADVQFLYDLTRAQPQNPDELLYEQRIFDEVFRIVDEARSFIVADFFLLNEQMGAAGAAHRPLSRELADHLIARKQAVPNLSVLLLTDPINDVYGGAPSPLLAELRKAGIDVVVTDLDRLARLQSVVLVGVAHAAAMVGQLRIRRPDGQSLHERRLRNHFAQLARAAELQGESSQADRRGSRRRHADGAGHFRESPRREQRAFERRAALFRRARRRHCREARWRSRASPAGVEISMWPPPRAWRRQTRKASLCRSLRKARSAVICSKLSAARATATA